MSKVTFDPPKTELPDGVEAASVNLVGEFNDWDTKATPMKRGKGGTFRVLVELEPGQEFQLRYLVDGERWCNEWHADAYVPNAMGVDNCVVVTPSAGS